ncbi:MAG: hypothetical protein H6739_19340 [Alphaproteobacteria bacterium]|nr:hypothetical protein [Alphaproteobacteria bacterium]
MPTPLLDDLLEDPGLAPLALLVRAAQRHREVRESAFVQARLDEHLDVDEPPQRRALAAHTPSSGPRRYEAGPWSLRVRERPGGGWFFGLDGPGEAALRLGEDTLRLTPRRWTSWEGPLPGGDLILRDADEQEIILRLIR